MEGDGEGKGKDETDEGSIKKRKEVSNKFLLFVDILMNA